MPSVILRPTGAAVGGGGTGVVAPTIVGSPPQLGDQSDATYVVVTQDPTTHDSNFVDAAQDPLTITPAFVTSAVAHARISSATAISARLRWLSSAVTFGHPILFTADDLALSGGEGIVERSAVIADVASGTYYSTWTMEQAATYLTASDVYVEVQIGSGIVTDLYVYDVWLEVFYTQAGINPLRRYPDGIGTGPTRHWPPPKSRRGYGGYH